MAPIQMLWVGDRLSKLERLSIASYLAHGHAVHLYAYCDVARVPPGTALRDAREILPESAVFTNPGSGYAAGTFAGFSDGFRFKLLLDRGGIWSDAGFSTYEKLKKRYGIA